jgi:hypothetical protein
VLNEMLGVERLEEIRSVGLLAAPDVPTVRVSDPRMANSPNRKLAFAVYREANLRVSAHGDRVFRSVAIAGFGRWRSGVSLDGDHPFRTMAISGFGA